MRTRISKAAAMLLALGASFQVAAEPADRYPFLQLYAGKSSREAADSVVFITTRVLEDIDAIDKAIPNLGPFELNDLEREESRLQEKYGEIGLMVSQEDEAIRFRLGRACLTRDIKREILWIRDALECARTDPMHRPICLAYAADALNGSFAFNLRYLVSDHGIKLPKLHYSNPTGMLTSALGRVLYAQAAADE